MPVSQSNCNRPSTGLSNFSVTSKSFFAEFPQQLKSLAWDLTDNHISLDNNGNINIPEEIGHGMKINQKALEQYKVDVDIYINKEKVF